MSLSKTTCFMNMKGVYYFYFVYDIYTHTHYKERKQLKTFLTQFGSVLPLTSDPPVRLHDDQRGGTTIKIAIWRAFLLKS
jgi:hypothetical protein